MRNLLLSLVIGGFLFGFSFAIPAKAMSTEERFHDLFVTAGYSTAFGAALGAAFVMLTPDPYSQLRWVGVGASLGFIGGSILGSYVIFTPIFTDVDDPSRYNLLADNRKGIQIRPVIVDNRFKHATASMSLFEW